MNQKTILNELQKVIEYKKRELKILKNHHKKLECQVKNFSDKYTPISTAQKHHF